jgi:GTP-binding protein
LPKGESIIRFRRLALRSATRQSQRDCLHQLGAVRGCAQDEELLAISLSMVWICATMGCGFSIVNISSAVFDRSAPDLDSCPDESLPEFAFIGRSNVGKSSLLNMLAGNAGLARVSPTPGFTKLINIFTMNKCWRLVDLPGYGHAQVARKDKAQFNSAVLNYLEHRTNLCLVFALIESGLEPQAIDLEFVEWLVRHALPFVLVFTKTDKVSAATVEANVTGFTARISAWFEKPPAVFTCSAETGQGRQALLGVIAEVTTAIDAAAVPAQASAPNSPSAGSQPRVRENRKRRPDLNRPW